MAVPVLRKPLLYRIKHKSSDSGNSERSCEVVLLSEKVKGILVLLKEEEETEPPVVAMKICGRNEPSVVKL